jgi:hypothetical protein
MPQSRPWVAAVIWPAATLVPPGDLAALIEFERGLAWAIIEETPHDLCRDPGRWSSWLRAVRRLLHEERP